MLKDKALALLPLLLLAHTALGEAAATPEDGGEKTGKQFPRLGQPGLEGGLQTGLGGGLQPGLGGGIQTRLGGVIQPGLGGGIQTGLGGGNQLGLGGGIQGGLGGGTQLGLGGGAQFGLQPINQQLLQPRYGALFLLPSLERGYVEPLVQQRPSVLLFVPEIVSLFPDLLVRYRQLLHFYPHLQRYASMRLGGGNPFNRVAGNSLGGIGGGALGGNTFNRVAGNSLGGGSGLIGGQTFPGLQQPSLFGGNQFGNTGLQTFG